MASGSANMTTFKTNVNSMMKNGLPSSDDFAILNTTAYTADQLGATNSFAIVNTPITGRPHDNHGAYLNIKSIGTPFQIMLGDSSMRYIYKRYYSSNAWQAWFKLDAGRADTWTTSRTLTIGGTGKGVDGSADVSWSKTEIIGSGTTAQFLRGDHTWTNTLANYIFNTTDMPAGATNMNTAATANTVTFYRNGILIPNPGTINDGGFMRVTGTGESDTILELGTWDDYGTGETIQFNYYPTSSQITPTYSVSVPKASGTICLTDGTGASGTWGISVTGNAATATKLGTSNVGSARQPIYLSGGTATAANYTVAHFGNAGKSNMNDVGRLHASTGMTNLSSTSNADTPMCGTDYRSGWHLYWSTNYSDDPNGSNAWVAQIVNRAGTSEWWVRSRSGGTITNGTAWGSGWRHLVTAAQAGVGGATTPVYISTTGEATACTAYANASVSNAVYLKDRSNSTASYLNYGAAGLAASAITWLCCWNGYEVRAISKAETFNLVRDNGGDSRWLMKNTAGGIASVSGGGSYWIVRVCTIKITGGYINRPIVLEISGRGRPFSIVQITFQNTSGTDPDIWSFSSNYGNWFYIKKTTTSTWELYAHYSEAWGSFCLHRITGYGADIGVTVNMDNYSSTNAMPSGATQVSYGGNVGYAVSAGSATSSGSCTGNANSANYTSHLLGVNSSNSPYGYSEGNIIRAVWNVHSDNRWYFRAGTYQCRVDYANTATTASSCTGNAATATKATQDGSGNTITSYYCTLSTAQTISAAKTFTAQILTSFKSSVAMGSYGSSQGTVANLIGEIRYSSGCMGSANLAAYTGTAGGSISAGWYNFIYSPHRSGGANGAASGDNHSYGSCILTGMTVGAQAWYIRVTSNAIAESRRIWLAGNSITNAVWNDLAECRKSEVHMPGYAITQTGKYTTRRLEPGCRITSDTWGFALGNEEDKDKMPVAISGRVLAYPCRPRKEYHLGDCVCSAPDGKVDIMTRQEIRDWPDCIIGIVNEIPDYEEWGSEEEDNTGRGKIKVNGRIWIDVR